MSDEARQSERPIEAIILAAGRGTRMGGDRAKVLYPVSGRAMVHWVLDACESVGVRRSVVVVGYQGDEVREELGGRRSCVFVDQAEQLGTGHAVMQAEPLMRNASGSDVLVLCGDGPLVRPATLGTLIATHRSSGASATLATATIDDPTGYGRIIRDAEGRLLRIVEHKDATDAERRVGEINPSYYCFGGGDLFDALRRVGNDNANGEYYLTDVLEILRRDGRGVSVVDAVPPRDVLSINTPSELAEVDRILQQRTMSEVRA